MHLILVVFCNKLGFKLGVLLLKGLEYQILDNEEVLKRILANP